MVTPMEEYLFDLRGYTVIRQALARDHVAAINAWLDAGTRPVVWECVHPILWRH
jgi:hypothetical protein